MTNTLRCYKCGASLETLSLPLRRLDEGPECRRELHVCRMCLFYDARLPKNCSEEDAPEVSELERANFCDYFKPSPNVYTPEALEVEQKARERLATLFVSSGTQATPADKSPDSSHHEAGRVEAENLFKK